MSAARRSAGKSKAKKADPGTVCRQLIAAAAQGELPRALLLMGPVRGEEEPWFAEQVLAAARRYVRDRPDLDVLEIDGGSPDFDIATIEGFLGARGLFGGERALLFARAGKALKKHKKLASLLAAAIEADDGPILSVIEAPGASMTSAVKPLTAIKTVQTERFRKLYADPPPWRPHDLDASEAAQFIAAEAKVRGLRLGPGAAGALVQISGGRPAELVQAVEHFALLDESTVSEAQVREVAAHSAEGSAFEFADALLEGDGRRAFRSLSQLRRRGLRSWDGKRIAPRDAFSMMLAVASKQRLQTAAVKAGLDAGMEQAAAFKAAGVAAGGPPAKRMEARLQRADQSHLDCVLEALLEAEQNVKRAGWQDPVRALEYLAMRCHRTAARR